MLTPKQEQLYGKIKERINSGNKNNNLTREEQDQMYEVFELLIEHAPDKARDFWKVLNVTQKTHICKNQHLPVKFIRWKWAKMTEIQRDLICLWQKKLSERFIVDKWNEITEEQKGYLYKNQKNFSEKFLKDKWPEMPEAHRDIVCEKQTLPKGFIREVWKNLTDNQKELILKHQKHLSKEFVRGIKSEEGPATLMSEFLIGR
jgi:hypothetical protein